MMGRWTADINSQDRKGEAALIPFAFIGCDTRQEAVEMRAFIVRACNAHAPNIARISEAVEMLQGNPSPEAIDTVRALLNAALESAKS